MNEVKSALKSDSVLYTSTMRGKKITTRKVSVILRTSSSSF